MAQESTAARIFVIFLIYLLLNIFIKIRERTEIFGICRHIEYICLGDDGIARLVLAPAVHPIGGHQPVAEHRIGMIEICLIGLDVNKDVFGIVLIQFHPGVEQKNVEPGIYRIDYLIVESLSVLEPISERTRRARLCLPRDTIDLE